jgi:hypothetical protein
MQNQKNKKITADERGSARIWKTQKVENAEVLNGEGWLRDFIAPQRSQKLVFLFCLFCRSRGWLLGFCSRFGWRLGCNWSDGGPEETVSFPLLGLRPIPRVFTCVEFWHGGAP